MAFENRDPSGRRILYIAAGISTALLAVGAAYHFLPKGRAYEMPPITAVDVGPAGDCRAFMASNPPPHPRWDDNWEWENVARFEHGCNDEHIGPLRARFGQSG